MEESSIILSITCEFCEKSKSNIVCKTCTKIKHYCTKCFKATHDNEGNNLHESYLDYNPQKIYKSYHEISDQLAKITECKNHKKALEFICSTCQMAICSDCVNENEHKNHNVEGSEEATNKVFEEARCICYRMEKDRDIICTIRDDNISRSTEIIHEEYEKCKEKLLHKFSILEEFLSSKKRELLGEVEENMKDEIQKLEKTDEYLKKAQLTIENWIKITHQIMKDKQISMYSDIKEMEKYEFSLPLSANPKLKKKIKIQNITNVLNELDHLRISIESREIFEKKITIPHKYKFEKEIHALRLPFFVEDMKKQKFVISRALHDNNPEFECYSTLEDLFGNKLPNTHSHFNHIICSVYNIASNGFLYCQLEDSDRIYKVDIGLSKIIDYFTIKDAMPRDKARILSGVEYSNLLLLQDSLNGKHYVAYCKPHFVRPFEDENVSPFGETRPQFCISEFITDPHMNLGKTWTINLENIGCKDGFKTIFICDNRVFIGKDYKENSINAEYNLINKNWEQDPKISLPPECKCMTWAYFLPQSYAIVSSTNERRIAYFVPDNS